MSERLTRKDIKRDIREDQLQETIGGLFAFLVQHTRALVAAGVGLILVALAVLGVFAYLRERADAASHLLDRAIRVQQAEIVASGAKPDDPRSPTFPDAASRRAKAKELFEQLRSDYSRAGAAEVADVYLGQIALEGGDQATARKLWQGFVQEHPDHMLTATVQVSLIRLDREQGRAEEAVEELRGMLEKEDKPLPVDLALFELGQTLEQLGRDDEARATYQRLGDEYPDSPYAPKARARVQSLDAGTEPS
jgi:tetratricopeptide (TPR) repeat protein